MTTGLLLELTTHSEDETRQVGAALAALVAPGDVVGLTGDLGAGKTRLVQGAMAALHSEDQVISPTFMLVREYDADLPVNHIDAYRLSGPAELEDLGLESVLDPEVVVFVEWADRVEAALAEGWLELRLEVEGETGRRITVVPHGGTWPARMGGLKAALGSFLQH
jgi:tRNA threonylcarbamoyladenosine biosynthesis protein TsaE